MYPLYFCYLECITVTLVWSVRNTAHQLEDTRMKINTAKLATCCTRFTDVQWGHFCGVPDNISILKFYPHLIKESLAVPLPNAIQNLLCTVIRLTSVKPWHTLYHFWDAIWELCMQCCRWQDMETKVAQVTNLNMSSTQLCSVITITVKLFISNEHILYCISLLTKILNQSAQVFQQCSKREA
jgi:hypothetical protein